MKNTNWEDLRLFICIAQLGSLSAAARETDLSVPTLGRRMSAFEESIGLTLFHRSRKGFTLTQDGQGLLQRARAMETAFQSVSEVLSRRAAKPLVRLSAGTGTTAFLASQIARLVDPRDAFRLSFVTSEARLDLGLREADLGIRNSRPSQGNLAAQCLGTLRFAPYRSRSATHPELLNWIALDPDTTRHPAAHWVLQEQQSQIGIFTSSVASLHDLLRGGAGMGVMPCMIGDSDPVLTRAGPIIEDLTEVQWLAMHADTRHRPDIRCVIDRVVALYRENTALIEGARPR